MKRKIQSAFRRLGYEINQKLPSLADFLESRKVELLIDVGANYGQFGKKIRELGYQGRIISFEPTLAAFKKLTEASLGDPKWEVHKFALGPRRGKATINTGSNDSMSSFKTQTSAVEGTYYHLDDLAKEEVDVIPLDDLLDKIAGQNSFLKLDTQSYEQEIISSGPKVTQILSGIVMELPIVHLYENTWTFDEAIKYMRDRGFILAQMKHESYHQFDRQSLVEVNAIFRRVSEIDA